MSKELEEPAIEGVIVEGPIPAHYWGIDLVSDGGMASSHFTVTADAIYANNLNFGPGGFYENA